MKKTFASSSLMGLSPAAAGSIALLFSLREALCSPLPLSGVARRRVRGREGRGFGFPAEFFDDGGESLGVDAALAQANEEGDG